jgi:hypothetical protein
MPPTTTRTADGLFLGWAVLAGWHATNACDNPIITNGFYLPGPQGRVITVWQDHRTGTRGIGTYWHREKFGIGPTGTGTSYRGIGRTLLGPTGSVPGNLFLHHQVRSSDNLIITRDL